MALESAKLPCGACGKLLDVKLNPKPKIVNLESVSMVVIEHTGQLACPCGATLMPVVMTVGTVGVHLQPVQPQAQKLIVEPGIGEIGRF